MVVVGGNLVAEHRDSATLSMSAEVNSLPSKHGLTAMGLAAARGAVRLPPRARYCCDPVGR